MTKHATDSPCAICGEGPIETVAAFLALPRVTSDCRPLPPGGDFGICAACGTVQKPADAAWSADATVIYNHYDMFRQAAERAEQAVFDQETGASPRRSALVLAHLSKTLPF